jgi:hypothetical protein
MAQEAEHQQTNVSYVENRPVLVCSDEDVQLETRVSEANDYDLQVELKARLLSGSDSSNIIDVYVPVRVWRAWVRAVERQIKSEYASRSVVHEEDESPV